MTLDSSSVSSYRIILCSMSWGFNYARDHNINRQPVCLLSKVLCCKTALIPAAEHGSVPLRRSMLGAGDDGPAD